jgi:hypothetical protein
LQFFIKKIFNYFLSCKFLSIFGHQNPGSALDPFPDRIQIRIGIQTKMLDLDPEQMNTDPKHWLKGKKSFDSTEQARSISIKFLCRLVAGVITQANWNQLRGFTFIETFDVQKYENFEVEKSFHGKPSALHKGEKLLKSQIFSHCSHTVFPLLDKTQPNKAFPQHCLTCTVLGNIWQPTMDGSCCCCCYLAAWPWQLWAAGTLYRWVWARSCR